MKQDQEAVGGVNRTEGEKPFMRNEPGEANPGYVDSRSLYAEGARNPERAALHIFCSAGLARSASADDAAGENEVRERIGFFIYLGSPYSRSESPQRPNNVIGGAATNRSLPFGRNTLRYTSTP
jgi:hypothetical protein